MIALNEVFKKHHGEEEKVTLFNNEFFFTLPDGSIMFRVFEYDSQIAIKDSTDEASELRVRFPNTALIYLRHTKNTPSSMKMVIEVPGDSCGYDIPILKVQSYGLEEIFEKKLFFLIPFHLFTYERDFREYDTDETKMAELTNHYLYLLSRLENCVKKGVMNTYTKNAIVAMTKKVMNHLTGKHEKVKEKLGDVMGGKILNYEAKDILNRGIEQAKVELIKKKLDKGQSMEQIAEALEESVETIQRLIEEYIR